MLYMCSAPSKQGPVIVHRHLSHLQRRALDDPEHIRLDAPFQTFGSAILVVDARCAAVARHFLELESQLVVQLGHSFLLRHFRRRRQVRVWLRPMAGLVILRLRTLFCSAGT